jgi:hypothetical protein
VALKWAGIEIEEAATYFTMVNSEAILMGESQVLPLRWKGLAKHAPAYVVLVLEPQVDGVSAIR